VKGLRPFTLRIGQYKAGKKQNPDVLVEKLRRQKDGLVATIHHEDRGQILLPDHPAGIRLFPLSGFAGGTRHLDTAIYYRPRVLSRCGNTLCLPGQRLGQESRKRLPCSLGADSMARQYQTARTLAGSGRSLGSILAAIRQSLSRTTAELPRRRPESGLLTG